MNGILAEINRLVTGFYEHYLPEDLKNEINEFATRIGELETPLEGARENEEKLSRELRNVKAGINCFNYYEKEQARFEENLKKSFFQRLKEAFRDIKDCFSWQKLGAVVFLIIVISGVTVLAVPFTTIMPMLITVLCVTLIISAGDVGLEYLLNLLEDQDGYKKSKSWLERYDIEALKAREKSLPLEISEAKSQVQELERTLLPQIKILNGEKNTLEQVLVLIEQSFNSSIDPLVEKLELAFSPKEAAPSKQDGMKKRIIPHADDNHFF